MFFSQTKGKMPYHECRHGHLKMKITPSAATLGFKGHLKWGTPQYKTGMLTAAH